MPPMSALFLLSSSPASPLDEPDESDGAGVGVGAGTGTGAGAGGIATTETAEVARDHKEGKTPASQQAHAQLPASVQAPVLA